MEGVPEELWYYLHPAHKEPIGPVPGEQLREMMANGKISKRTMVWKEGMENWDEAGNVASLQKTERVAVDPTLLKKPK